MTVPTGNLLSADYSSGTVQGSFYINTSHWILTKNSEELCSIIIFVLQKTRLREVEYFAQDYS